MDQFLDVQSLNFVNMKARVENSTPGPVAYCKDLDGLIQLVNERRENIDTSPKFGIDGGGGFLKICLSIQSLTLSTEVPDKPPGKKFKDTGVKKLIVLAIAPNAQENYENISRLWDLLQINHFSGIIATDPANILLGIMTGNKNSCTSRTWTNL